MVTVKMVPMEKKMEKEKRRGRDNVVKGERNNSPMKGIFLLMKRHPPRRKKRQMKVVEIKGRARRKPFLIE